MGKRSSLIFLVLAVLLTLPALWGILHEGLFVSDDGNWMVIRFSAFFEALRNGQFPVRFLSRLNNGYGYPVADFLYPLFMYIGVPIHAIGFSFVNTIKIIFGASLILSSVFSFLYLRKLFDNVSSLVGSLAYALFPYHLWDLYKRGSVGEVLALAIVPLILWAIEIGSLPLAGLGYGLLILSHNSLALLFLPVLLGYQFLKSDGTKAMRSIKAVGLGLLLSCFFWLPALYDKQFTIFDSTQVSDFRSYFVTDYNLFGFTTLVALVGSLALLGKGNVRFRYFFAVVILAIFFSTSISSIIWQNLPIVGFVQFPFRVLSIAILGVSFLLAYQLSRFKSKFKIASSAVYVFLIFFSAWPFLMPKAYQDHPDSFYS
ncbi:MAG: 6-pyruvoyl-tetrahydropterin synthase-related protein, partial [Candidatus Levyibacteriota bacterium]